MLRTPDEKLDPGTRCYEFMLNCCASSRDHELVEGESEFT